MSDNLHDRIVRTLSRKKDSWEANIKANKPLIKTGIDALWNDGAIHDGMLVAAGPSLKFSLNEIKEKSSERECCCVDMAVSYLINNDIIPDFIICGESNDDIVKTLKDIKQEIPLICDVTVNPNVPLNWKGPIFWYITYNNCIDLDNNKKTFSVVHSELSGICSTLVAGGNVGSMGLSFMLNVRDCRQLYLYGHDFCWKDNNEFYCGSMQQELANKRIESETNAGTLYTMKDNNGDDVKTNLSLVTFRDFYKTISDNFPGCIINRSVSSILNVENGNIVSQAQIKA